MDDFNSIINYKLTEFINNLNKKYNTSLNINHYIINDEVKRCINRINDCGLLLCDGLLDFEVVEEPVFSMRY